MKVASVACLASSLASVSAFLPAAPIGSAPAVVNRQCSWRVYQGLADDDGNVEDTKKVKFTDQKSWEEEIPYQVHEEDLFVLREDVADYKKLTADEKKKLEAEVKGAHPEHAHQTFVPHNHPFAHARILNVVVRVSDLGRTVKFYEAVGLTQLRDRVSEGYTATVMGYGSEEFGQSIGVQFVQERGGSVDIGDGYQGLTVVVPDVAEAVSKAKSAGGRVVKDVRVEEYAANQIPEQDAQDVNRVTEAIIQDPDGYKCTLVQGDEPDLKAITLRVFDQEQAVAFYNALGMKLLYKRANLPVDASMSAGVGYDDDHVFTMGFVHPKLKEPQFHMFTTPKTLLDLKYDYDSKEVRTGNGLAQLVIGVYHGVDTALEHLRSAGAKVVLEPSQDDKGDVAAVADVDGYTVTLVDIEQFNELLS